LLYLNRSLTLTTPLAPANRTQSVIAAKGNDVLKIADQVAVIARQLALPFTTSEVRYKPGAISGARALALPYVDARVVQARLDAVLGLAGWTDNYLPLPNGSVVCTLRCKIGRSWIARSDVGGPSEQNDEGDRTKAAFSDALKRAAVKFGVGRYLYSLPQQWFAYDPQRRRFATPPPSPTSPVAKEASSNGRDDQRR
jgi:hypothetical protein